MLFSRASGTQYQASGLHEASSRISLASVVARADVLARGLDPPTFWPLPAGLHPVISLSTVGFLRSARSSETASACISDKGATIIDACKFPRHFSPGILGPRLPAQSRAKMPRFQWRFFRQFSSEAQCKNEFQGNSRMPSRARNFKIDFEGLQFRPPDGLAPWNLTQSFIWMVPRPLSNARTFGQLRPLFKNTDLPQCPPHNNATAPLISPTILSSSTTF